MNAFSSVVKKIKKYLSYNSKEKLLFIKAFFITGICNFIINRIPIRKYNKMLGEQNKESDAIISKNDKLMAEKLGDITEIVSKYTPWHSECFVKAMTCGILLKQEGIESTLYMGVRKRDSKMTAHAWLRCGDVYVMGGRGEGYAVVQKYKKTTKKV